MGVLDDEAYCTDCGEWAVVDHHCRDCTAKHEAKWQKRLNSLTTALAAAEGKARRYEEELARLQGWEG